MRRRFGGLAILLSRAEKSVAALERSDDNGSHRVVRPGDYERSFTFDIA